MYHSVLQILVAAATVYCLWKFPGTAYYERERSGDQEQAPGTVVSDPGLVQEQPKAPEVTATAEANLHVHPAGPTANPSNPESPAVLDTSAD